MRFEDCYPLEVVEWAQALPELDDCTPQQLRIIKILKDEEVIKKAAYVFDKLDKTLDRTEATQRIDNFCAFIEDAAALPDLKPVGARWHLDQYAEFYTRKEIMEELQQIKLTAQPLAALLERHSNLIIFDKIEELQNLLNEFLASPQMLTPFDTALPNHGKMAGAHSWRDEIYRKLCTMAEVRLGNRHQAFTRDVHRVLLDLEMPLDANTAHYVAGKPSKLSEN